MRRLGGPTRRCRPSTRSTSEDGAWRRGFRPPAPREAPAREPWACGVDPAGRFPMQPPVERTENQCRTRVMSRRGFLLLAGSTTSLVLLAACGGATAPAKPTEAPKPAAPAAEATKPAAATQAASGPDIFQLQHNWAYLYKDALVDVSDLVDEVKKATGDLYPMPEAYTKVEGRYLAVPHDMIGTVMHWRKAWFREAGLEQ